MSNYPNIYNIKSATGKLNNFNLSKSVITTNDFGTIMPIECKFMVPGDKFKVNIRNFTRLMPLPCPTYGKIECVTRAFFVPFRYIVPHWNEFISGNKYATTNGLHNPELPSVFYRDIVKRFANDTSLAVGISTGEFDLTFDSSTRYKYRFTPKGRMIAKFLRNLGLPLSGSTNTDGRKVSVLPILCFWKFYLDWIVPSRYLNEYQKLRGLLNQTSFSDADMKVLLDVPHAFLEDDFFTSAFQNPDGYENSTANNYVLHNSSEKISVEEASVGFNPVYSINNSDGNNNSGAYIDSSSDSSQFGNVDVVGINRFTLKSLGALQDLINRGKLAGTKIQDYLVAEFGLRPSDDALQLSKYLGSFRDDIKIGDVMAQSDTKTSTGGAYLGEYAGKALGSSEGHFEYETKDHGMIFFTHEIIVRSSYVQGVRPEFMILDRFDCFQPEFDNLGTEPIDTTQLLGFTNGGTVFGFTPTYSKYKTNFDTLSGDFAVPSLGGSPTGTLGSWYLSRWFTEDPTVFYVGKSFQFADNYGNGLNYDRIFQQMDGDHFYQIFQFDIKASRPMQTISDALETEETNKMGHDKKIDFQNTMH